MTDPGGDMRMEGDATEEREDDSPLHAANTTNTAAPSASGLAAAAAALWATQWILRTMLYPIRTN